MPRGKRNIFLKSIVALFGGTFWVRNISAFIAGEKKMKDNEIFARGKK